MRALTGFLTLLLSLSLAAQEQQAECDGPYKGEALSRETLDQVLAAHAEWISDINKDKLNADDPDPRRANLCGANLRDIDLTGASLRRANLQDADLGGRQPNPRQTAGSQLAGRPPRGRRPVTG